MFKVRYEITTGKVNLITNSDEEVTVTGCKYMKIDKYPEFDNTSQHLYVKNGKLMAVNIDDK